MPVDQSSKQVILHRQLHLHAGGRRSQACFHNLLDVAAKLWTGLALRCCAGTDAVQEMINGIFLAVRQVVQR